MSTALRSVGLLDMPSSMPAMDKKDKLVYRFLTGECHILMNGLYLRPRDSTSAKLPVNINDAVPKRAFFTA
jgi:hypothetical protein